MIIVMHAYGKRYSSEEEVKKAWENNQDFKIIDGPYINLKDFLNYCDPTLDSVFYNFDDISFALNTGCLN